MTAGLADPRQRSFDTAALGLRSNADPDGTLLEPTRLTARGSHRAVRVARGLTDLDGQEQVRRAHVAEALSYRRAAPGRR